MRLKAKRCILVEIEADSEDQYTVIAEELERVGYNRNGDISWGNRFTTLYASMLKEDKEIKGETARLRALVTKAVRRSQ